MATYEYVCLSCEHPFEERRSMTGAVDTALACPACESDRVRRRFSLFATGPGTGAATGPASGGAMDAPSAGCCGGGGCACGG